MVLKVGRGASAPPFMVMDVIAAANARQASLPAGAPRVIRMEVGQPGTGAPAGAIAAVEAALRSGATWATPRRSGALAAGTHRRPYPDLVWPDGSGRAHCGDRGGLGRVSARLSGGVRSRRPDRHGRAVLPTLRQYPDRSRHAAGDPGSRAGDTVPAERGDAGSARSASGRVDRGQPLQSGRHHVASGRTGCHCRLVRRERRAADQRRDLSRPDLRQPDRHRRGIHPACHRGQQLLEILLDDWLAGRLAGASGRSGPPGRMPGAEPVHQCAAHLPGGGRSGVRLSHRASGQHCSLPAFAGPSADRAARGRLRPPFTGRGSFLPLRRHCRPVERQRGVLRPHAGGGRDRRNAGG